MTYVINVKEVSGRLRALRAAKAIPTQEAMAELIGAARNQYNNWERGSLIPVAFAIRICAITGATLDYIYKGDKSGLPLNLVMLLEGSAPTPSTTRKRA